MIAWFAVFIVACGGTHLTEIVAMVIIEVAKQDAACRLGGAQAGLSSTQPAPPPKKKGLMTGPFLFGGEGEITRRCAPRPFGAALAGVIPASACGDLRSHTDELFWINWRRG